MSRPVEIVWFERLILGTLALGLIQSWLAWSELTKLASPGFILTTQFFSFGVVGGLALLVSRRRSTVAKWISVALFLVGLPFMAKQVLDVQLMGSAWISVIQTVGQLIAYSLLFAPGAVRWLKQNKLAA